MLNDDVALKSILKDFPTQFKLPVIDKLDDATNQIQQALKRKHFVYYRDLT